MYINSINFATQNVHFYPDDNILYATSSSLDLVLQHLLAVFDAFHNSATASNYANNR